MFELSVRAEFCAAHAILIGGQREMVHGHNWRVTATVMGPALDKEGLLCDFHLVERGLKEVIGPYDNGDLNRTAPFTDLNPTAENVARHIAESLGATLDSQIRPAGVAWVRVTEAPGCSITYWTPFGLDLLASTR